MYYHTYYTGISCLLVFATLPARSTKSCEPIFVTKQRLLPHAEDSCFAGHTHNKMRFGIRIQNNLINLIPEHKNVSKWQTLTSLNHH